jgi:hypothetical protein
MMTEGKSIHDRRSGVGRRSISENAWQWAKVRSVIELSAEFGTAKWHASPDGDRVFFCARTDGPGVFWITTHFAAEGAESALSHQQPSDTLGQTAFAGLSDREGKLSWKGNGVDDVEPDR